jgi:nucleotide-binding universal stress UspA family protein
MYQHIMVPLDGSELAECVLPHVEALAAGCDVSRVTLVRVVTPLHLYGGAESGLSPEERQRVEADSTDVARAYLDRMVTRLADMGVSAQSEVLFGNIIDRLVDYADKNGVDLIIIATHGRSGVSRWVWGSVADRALRSAKMPVLMVRAPGSTPGV